MKTDQVGTIEERHRQLLSWAEATELEIQEIAAAIAPLQQRLQATRERLDLIQRLMRLGNGSIAEALIQSGKPRHGRATGPARSTIQSQGGTDVEDHLETILQESERPMHIRDLRKALIQRGIPLPGRGDEANIILRLGRAKDRFVRTGRGMYGLTEWGITPVPPMQRKKRVYRRRRAT
jgi:hypothetical protein